MGTLVALLALATITIVSGVFALTSKSEDARTGYGLTSVATALIGAVWTAVACTTVVGANEVGVPVTFGKAGAPMQSGLQVTAPWTDVKTLPTRAESCTVCTQVRTNQSGSLKVCTTARWAVDRDRARTVYLNTRADAAEGIASKIVAPYQRQASNFVYAKYDNVTAINAREKAQGAISDLLKVSLAAQGLRLDSVMLGEVEPDKATSDATARYAAELLKTKIAEQSVFTAEQEALRKVAEAEGTAAAAKKLPDLSGADLDVLCVQAWQEAVAAATARGVALYTHPCGGGASVLAK